MKHLGVCRSLRLSAPAFSLTAAPVACRTTVPHVQQIQVGGGTSSNGSTGAGNSPESTARKFGADVSKRNYRLIALASCDGFGMLQNGAAFGSGFAADKLIAGIRVHRAARQRARCAVRHRPQLHQVHRQQRQGLIS
jgi:hypothetical protein